MVLLKDLIYFKITGAIENTVFSDVTLNQEIPESMIYFLKTTNNNFNGYVKHDNKIWKYFDNVHSILSDKLHINHNNMDFFYIDLYVIYAFMTVIRHYFPNIFRGILISEQFLEFYYLNKSDNLQYLKNIYTDYEMTYIHSIILPFVKGIGKYCKILVIFNNSYNEQIDFVADRQNVDATETLSKKTKLEHTEIFENNNFAIISEICIDVKFLNSINDSKIRRLKIPEYQKINLYNIKEWTFVKIDNEHKYIKDERYERFSSMNSEVPFIDFSQINILSTIHIVSADQENSSNIYVNISTEFDEILLFTIN